MAPEGRKGLVVAVKQSISPAVAVIIVLVVIVVVALIGWKVIAGKTDAGGEPAADEQAQMQQDAGNMGQEEVEQANEDAMIGDGSTQ